MIEIPEWKFSICEVFAGHWQLTGRRSSGNVVEISSSNEDIFRVVKAAFEIECQLSKDLYRTAYLTIEKNITNISEQQYLEKVFGSWYIEKQDRRVVFDGRDKLFSFELRKAGVWHDEKVYQWRDMFNFSEVIKAVLYLN